MAESYQALQSYQESLSGPASASDKAVYVTLARDLCKIRS